MLFDSHQILEAAVAHKEGVQNPAISVVMVVCNADRFLEEAIESILNQTFRDFEFIIVDFGSTDKSLSIIESYSGRDRRIKFHATPNCALAEARNTGCFLARGRYIAIMDADDVSEQDRLKLELAFMEAHLDFGVVGGATDWIDAKGKLLRTDRLPTEDHEIREALESRCPFCQSTMLIRKEAFYLVGGYRGLFAQAEDYDLWLRISEHFKCANLSQVVLKYRIHPHQISIRKRAQQTLCVLAAQVAASSRARGLEDPMESVEEITPAVLAGLGVNDARQQIAVASDYLLWTRHLYSVGEHSAALSAATDVLSSCPEHIERWQIADLRLMMARIYWKQRRFASSLLAAGQAFATRPLLLGRPFKLLLHHFQSAVSPQEVSSMRFRQ
jgi:hypothetical protein